MASGRGDGHHFRSGHGFRDAWVDLGLVGVGRHCGRVVGEWPVGDVPACFECWLLVVSI